MIRYSFVQIKIIFLMMQTYSRILQPFGSIFVGKNVSSKISTIDIISIVINRVHDAILVSIDSKGPFEGFTQLIYPLVPFVVPLNILIFKSHSPFRTDQIISLILYIIMRSRSLRLILSKRSA